MADRLTGQPFTTRSEIIAQHGMAATSQPLATQVAIDILKQGGNAIDAAIAANALLGLVEPTGSGIGGDLFAIIWDAQSQQLFGLNGSGRSPISLPLNYFSQQKLTAIPAFGPLSVSTPGTVDAWYEMHQKFGSLSMATLFQPTIDYAEQGFPMTETISIEMALSAKHLQGFPNFAQTYMPNGMTPTKGTLFKNPHLANTLKHIAKYGRNGFYKGDIAKTISRYMKDNGGFLNEEDLSQHKSEWVTPISTHYRGFDVWELPPNGQGIAVLQILNMLEQHDISRMGFGSEALIHTVIETIKLVYEDRAKFYCDPDFNHIPIKTLLSKDYAQKRNALIHYKANLQVGSGMSGSHHIGQNLSALNHGDTVYLTTADKQGNMVSLIQSNYRGMGSGMTPTNLGFVLQNRGQLFSLHPQDHNVYQPNKRPFNTIIPAFVTQNDKPWLSFGVMGGPVQPQMQVQILMNLIDFKMNLQEAGDAPRFLHAGTSQPTGKKMTQGGYISLESGFSASVMQGLIDRGHDIQDLSGEFGGYQAIAWNDKKQVYFGASESRKDGQASGY
ncbi:gamma-glutamyltransferase [uncultured Shewanella sp.]|uniref:gamma-glutamyltransferase n=1 Tax=uncultured Shewanella sp. TaxID=173975 RepID=UPI00260C5BDE|nr:gamma-glutamyltransferase [uncultured Shewanella sp.]